MQRDKAIAIAKEVGAWIPTLLLATVFIPQGISKFSATSGWMRAFEHWGYPGWFRMLVGGVELSAGLLLLWRRMAPIAALMILMVMAGAMWTHVWIDHRPKEVFHEAVPTTLAIIVLIVRRKQLANLLARPGAP
jgi:uncharacterized membrane protein YphA (DoxX/SURF4 family)